MITRRTQRFAELATAVERECGARGVTLPPATVDELLNERITHVAELMRVTERTALWYCPDDLPGTLADQLTNG